MITATILDLAPGPWAGVREVTETRPWFCWDPSGIEAAEGRHIVITDGHRTAHWRYEKNRWHRLVEAFGSRKEQP
jgi:hypothetical protein